MSTGIKHEFTFKDVSLIPKSDQLGVTVALRHVEKVLQISYGNNGSHPSGHP